MLAKVEFASFAVDPESNTPLVVLREINGNRMLPVQIGPLEAGVIAMETLDVNPRKPSTVDVAKSILEKLGGALERVVFLAPRECLMARLDVGAQGNIHSFECRPSDAIALALRCKAPFFVRDGVFEKFSAKSSVSEREKLRKDIAAIDTLEFGTYYLE